MEKMHDLMADALQESQSSRVDESSSEGKKKDPLIPCFLCQSPCYRRGRRFRLLLLS